ncbi:hypothetical protein [Rhodoligotrophos defluvii]|uniref:hypothetical protein n=1 Tax=Rhodoligotrophos defluvii TaxID=2561934 RepID=UPI0010C9556F|nr:hypothetical protein [Rhodoligotrophos defluvii]
MGTPVATKAQHFLRRYTEAKINTFRQLFTIERLVRVSGTENPHFEQEVRLAIAAGREQRHALRCALLDAIAESGEAAHFWLRRLDAADRAARPNEATFDRLLSLDRIADIRRDAAHAQDFFTTLRVVANQIFRPYSQLLTDIVFNQSNQKAPRPLAQAIAAGLAAQSLESATQAASSHGAARSQN